MSLLAHVQAGCLMAFVLLLLAAGWQDLRTLRIANRISVGIAATFALWAAAGLVLGHGTSLPQIGASLACGAGIFALGTAAFAAGVLGGGDVKLLSAASLFAGPTLLIDFLLIASLAGGAMALAMLADMPIGPAVASGDTVRTRLRGALPYGPAIAVGGIWVAASLAAF